MATVFAQNVIEIAVHATHGGKPHVNVLHFQNDEGFGSDASKVEDVRNNWQDHMTQFLANSYVIQGFEWRSLDPDDNNVGYVAPDPAKPTQGVGAAAAAASSHTYLIHKRTTNRPRGRRDGRIFLSGIPEVQAGADGVIDPTWRATVDGYLATFLSGVNDDGFGLSAGSGMVVLETTPASRAPGTQAVTIGYRPVTSLVLDPVLGHQRDRVR